ncbi:FadR/GntR family transcriptional regulator [uncultured Cohaesibacter sp.]|uniref:FadR/GntR family transcriptional regulator n=1 Tax=uncultured Cohaesibacter sp. TaxID=1002546 RepID=UPI0029C5FCF4|nr:FadR/GntR family transcriptional regulator [uncultured Cohaesibacter sp.]
MATSFKFADRKKRSLLEGVTEGIAIRILSGDLMENSAIPSEQELSQQLGISRATIREAIKLLTSKGLLESIPKVGTMVRPRSNWNALDPQVLTWMTSSSDPDVLLEQFLQLRRSIEPMACALAARNATEEQRQQLTTLIEEMSKASERSDTTACHEADLQFHSVIFQASGNLFYIPFANLLQSAYSSFFHHSLASRSIGLKDHRHILDAILARDPERAYHQSAEMLKTAQFPAS